MARKSYADLSDRELIRKMETHRRLAATIAAELLKRAMGIEDEPADEPAAV